MPELTYNEQNFIFILRAALEDRIVDAEKLPCELDISAVMKLAYNHKLWHMLLSALPDELLPPEVDRRVELFRRVASQVATTSAFIELWSAMEEAGFHPIVVKGIICRTLYHHPELRPSSDEDLYIPKGEFEACCRFLLERGLIPDKNEPFEYDEVGWRGQNGVFIELHRDLFAGDLFDPFRELFGFELFTPEPYMTHYGVAVSSMPPHDHLLYLLTHAFKHFVHSGFGIRQVCDIGIWAREYNDRIDWQLLYEQCERIGIIEFVCAVLAIARDILELRFDLPEAFVRDTDYCMPLLKDILCGGIYGSADADRVHSGNITLNSIGRARRGRKHIFLRSLFPPRFVLKGKYHYLDRFPFLLPVAWISRLASYLWRNATGNTSVSGCIRIGRERLELMTFYGLLD